MIVRSAGTGSALVVIHGFGVDHRILTPLERLVGDAPWRRIYLDLPWAEGSSGSTASSTLEVADEVVAEIREHLGEEPFAVVGNSFGAMIARYVAHELRPQVLGLATLAGVFVASHEARTVPPRTVVRAGPAVLEQAGDVRADFAENSVIQTAETLAAFTAHVLPGLRGSDQQVMDRIAAAYVLPTEPEVAHPEPFAAPSLHVFGRQDEVVGYEDGWRLRDHYPRATYVVLDAAGHNVHLEQPAVTGALLRDWLLRMDDAR